MRFSLRDHRWLLAAPLLLLATACGGGGDEEAGADAAADSAPAATQAPAAMTAGTLTDGNIVAILAASGNSEILPSDSVVNRLENALVKRFADSMITQHTALNDTVTWVAQQNNITAAPNASSAQLDSMTSAEVQRLKGLSGAALDRAFMEYMVQSHQGALTAVDSTLIPAAQNPQLRTAMQKDVLPMVERHLAEANRIIRELGSP